MSQRAGMTFTGNAIATPMLAALFIPMLEDALRSGVMQSGDVQLGKVDIIRLALRAHKLRWTSKTAPSTAETSESSAIYEVEAMEVIGRLTESLVKDEDSRRRSLVESMPSESGEPRAKRTPKKADSAP